MNQSIPQRRSNLAGIVIAFLALALVAYYFWPRSDATPESPQASGTTTADAGPDVTDQAITRPGLPAGAHEVGGILVDAQGNRILSEAGLPLSKEPLPQAKPIPVKAPPGEVIGYAKDAQGNSTPIRAGDLKTVPNAPGTFAVVDMWAEGGPTVVPATKGQTISEAELAKMRAEEDRRDRAGREGH
jgi:hypothetical protein